MEISNLTIEGKQGFEIEWILQEHLNEIGEVDHDCTEYGVAVYDNLDEAKTMLKKKAKSAPCYWGTLYQVEYEYIEGLPYGWQRLSDHADFYVEDL